MNKFLAITRLLVSKQIKNKHLKDVGVVIEEAGNKKMVSGKGIPTVNKRGKQRKGGKSHSLP